MSIFRLGNFHLIAERLQFIDLLLAPEDDEDIPAVFLIAAALNAVLFPNNSAVTRLANAEIKLFFKNAVMSRLANSEMLLFANRSAGSPMAGARKTVFLNGSNTIQKSARGTRRW